MNYFPADLFFMPALVASVAAALAGRALRRRGRRRPLGPGGPPRCGACGYDTRGLTRLTCPECGSDLRIVGIGGAGLTRRAPRLVSFAACAVFLAFVMYAWSGVLTNMVLPILPSRLEYRNEISVTSRTVPDRSFTIRSTGRGGTAATPPPPVTIEMALRGGGQRVTLVYDPARQADFGPKTVLDWMRAANVTDAAAPTEAARVAGLARKVARYTRGREVLDYAYGGSGGSRSGGSSGGSTGIFSSFGESFSTRPSSASVAMFQALRAVWAVLLLALLVVLFRAIVFPRAASPAFTPHAGGE